MIMMDVGQHGFYHIIINFEMSYLTYCIVLSAEWSTDQLWKRTDLLVCGTMMLVSVHITLAVFVWQENGTYYHKHLLSRERERTWQGSCVCAYVIHSLEWHWTDRWLLLIEKWPFEGFYGNHKMIMLCPWKLESTFLDTVSPSHSCIWLPEKITSASMCTYQLHSSDILLLSRPHILKHYL